MLLTYFTIAWRNLFKNKFYSVINILGLTVGLTVSLLILLWVNDEQSFDRFHKKTDRIYRINSSMGTGGTTQVSGKVQAPLASFGAKEVPGIVGAVRIAPSGDYQTLSYKGRVFKAKDVFFTDPSLFKVFSFKLISGNIDHPFADNKSIILTESAAKCYFGSADPVGKVLTADTKDNLVVSGVVADFPQNSTINFEMLLPISSIKTWDMLSQDWSRYIFQTYVLVQPGATLKSIEQKLIHLHHQNQPLANVTDGNYHLQPLRDIHLFAPDGSALGANTVKAFLIVAILILLIVSVNYVNLSSARAMLRAKEVSMRKVLGAGKVQLYLQFFIETLLVFMIGLCLAILLIQLVMPFYNEVSGKQMQFSLLDFSTVKVVALTLIFTMAASGIYPVLLLSSFNPVNALKGKLSIGIGAPVLKKVLVVGQFSFAIVLIIGTLLINKQLRFIRGKELGYDKSHVFSISTQGMQGHESEIKAELLTNPQIIAVTSGSNSITDNDFTTSDTQWDEKDKNSTFLVHVLETDKDFLRFFKIKLAGGSGFTGTQSDSSHYILNETAVKEAGITGPIGKHFVMNHSNVNGTIIGVVKDFHFSSLKQKIAPLVFVYSNQNKNLYLKTTGKNAFTAIQAVSQIWKRYNPDRPFTYSFLKEEYDNLYRSEQKAGVLFNFFAAVSVFISCLGLFALAGFTAQVKVKEIGIRKVLGASVVNITAMLSMEYLKLVLVAILIATPVAWLTMNKYLEDFAYRTDLNFGIFAVASISTLVIALATISFQSVKAALATPVKSLRSE